MTSILNSPINLYTGQLAPDGVPPQLKPHLDPIYAALQQVQLAFVQYAGVAASESSLWNQLQPSDSILIQNMGRVYGRASEAINFGAIVNVHDDGTTYAFRNANATTNVRFAVGYCSTVAGIASGGYGEFIVGHGLCAGISGLTRGAKYYLSTVNGLVTTVAPVAVGNIEQLLGFAFTTKLLYFSTNYWIPH